LRCPTSLIQNYPICIAAGADFFLLFAMMRPAERDRGFIARERVLLRSKKSELGIKTPRANVELVETRFGFDDAEELSWCRRTRYLVSMFGSSLD
jgi:hypothetical protein